MNEKQKAKYESNGDFKFDVFEENKYFSNSIFVCT